MALEDVADCSDMCTATGLTACTRTQIDDDRTTTLHARRESQDPSLKQSGTNPTVPGDDNRALRRDVSETSGGEVTIERLG